MLQDCCLYFSCAMFVLVYHKKESAVALKFAHITVSSQSCLYSFGHAGTICLQDYFSLMSVSHFVLSELVGCLEEAKFVDSTLHCYCMQYFLFLKITIVSL